MLFVTKFVALSFFITGSVALDGAHQQIIHWFKSLNNTDLISCDKRSKFTFKEENVLTDSVKCQNDVPGITENYHFFDFDYSTNGSYDGVLKGKGRLLIHNEGEEMGRLSGTKLRALSKDPNEGPKKMCVRYGTFLGSPVTRASGVFMKGRLTGEGSILTLKKDTMYVNFVKGVPHGRARKFDDFKNLNFVGTVVDGKIDGPCWQFMRDGNFYYGICSAQYQFQIDSEVIVGNSNSDQMFSCKYEDNILTNCRKTKVDRIEANNDCIMFPKTITNTKETETKETFKLNILTSERSDQSADGQEEILCLGSHSTTSWSEDVSNTFHLYFHQMSKGGYWMDPFWTQDSDPSDVDKKSIKLISNIDNIEGNAFEAVINLNGAKEALEFQYVGSIDPEGHFHGPAKLVVATTKKMCLRGKCNYPTLQEISGTFVHGILEGTVKITGVEEYFVTHCKVKHGALHGYFVTFGWKPIFEKNPILAHHMAIYNRLHHVSYFGRYQNGKPVGKAWIGLVGYGFLFGDADVKHPGKITSDSAAFIYTGMKHAIVGKYEGNLLKAGQFSNVVRQRCENGIRVVEFSAPEGPTFKFDPPTEESFGDSPLVRDPYEEKMVKLSQSGDSTGVFATTDIPQPGSLVSLYSGLMYNTQGARSIREFQCDTDSRLPKDKRARCTQNRKYLYNGEDYIDIPEELDNPETFQATVGHKVRHSLEPNAAYGLLDHPRFGLIHSIVSIVPIKAGDEILVNHSNNLSPIIFK